MAVSPRDLLAIAQELIDREGEIDHRTAANRAYYAAFHYCSTVAASLPPPLTPGRRSHERLISKLKNHPVSKATEDFDLNVRTLGNVLDKAKPLRVHADYLIGEEFGRAKAEELIPRAEKIRDVANELTETLSVDT